MARQDKARQRHANHYFGIVQDAEKHWKTADQSHWLQRIEVEYDNLRRALEWSLEKSPGPAMNALTGLFWFWEIRGLLDEGRDWGKRFILQCDRHPPCDQHPPCDTRGRILCGLGNLAFRQSDYAESSRYFESARVLFERSGEPSHLCRALHGLALNAEEQGEYDRAEEFYLRELEIESASANSRERAVTIGNLAGVAFARGDLDKAHRFYQESLDISLTAADASAISLALNNLGVVSFYRQDYDSALDFHSRSLEQRRELQDLAGIALSLTNLGGVYLRKGDDARAHLCQIECLNIRKNLGDKMGLAYVLGELGAVALALRDYEIAVALLSFTEKYRTEIGTPFMDHEKDDFDSYITELRKVFIEPAFHSAWKQGQDMTIEVACVRASQIGMLNQRPTTSLG